ncbi:MAG: hypothetical protein Q9M26_07040 [Mariprofundales bacterium]|nr:hypothetical protein [Mariprofundales bacterium]
MKLSAHQLAASKLSAYYLHGENRDGVELSANTLFARASELPHLRLDVDRLAEIEQQWGNPTLFGPNGCVALVRNADAARYKQVDHLLAMVERVPPGSLLILCAVGAMWKKAIHKKLIAIPALAHCDFHTPTPGEFLRWLHDAANTREINLSQETLELASERLCGLQQAATQWLERLSCYADGDSAPIPWSVAATLLGEQAPEALEEWCHALAMREPRALKLQRRLVREQRVSEVQMVRWIGIRMQQIVLYRWHQSQRAANPIAAAKVFGDARKRVPKEAAQWPAEQLSGLLSRIRHAEQLLKGASLQSKEVVLEHLTCDLLRGQLNTAPTI